MTKLEEGGNGNKLTPVDRVRRWGFRIFALGGSIAVGALAIPILKTWLMGSEHRISDIEGTAIAGLMGLAFLLMIIGHKKYFDTLKPK